MRVLNNGDHGLDVQHLQSAINRRLESRSSADHKVKVDGSFGPATRKALVTACYLLGMEMDKIDGIKHGSINTAEQTFVRNPGKRSDAEKDRGQLRVKKVRAARKKAEAVAAKASAHRKEIVSAAKLAAANYRKNPGAYHYLAGGIANTIFLHPTPSNWRSDCSQFAASVYKEAGLPSPASPLAHQWASTFSIVKSPHARITKNPKPGDLGMYGSTTAPHHVEVYIGEPGCKFIGHGSPPIDSLTPGNPDYYVTLDFLD